MPGSFLSLLSLSSYVLSLTHVLLKAMVIFIVIFCILLIDDNIPTELRKDALKLGTAIQYTDKEHEGRKSVPCPVVL